MSMTRTLSLVALAALFVLAAIAASNPKVDGVRGDGGGDVRGRRTVCGLCCRDRRLHELHVPAFRRRRREREGGAQGGVLWRGGLHGAEDAVGRDEEPRCAGLVGGRVVERQRRGEELRHRRQGGDPAHGRRVPRHAHFRGDGLAYGVRPSRARRPHRGGGVRRRRQGRCRDAAAPLLCLRESLAASFQDEGLRLPGPSDRPARRGDDCPTGLQGSPCARDRSARRRNRYCGGAVRARYEHLRRRGDRPARGFRALRVPLGVGPYGRRRGRAERGDDGLRPERRGSRCRSPSRPRSGRRMRAGMWGGMAGCRRQATSRTGSSRP